MYFRHFLYFSCDHLKKQLLKFWVFIMLRFAKIAFRMGTLCFRHATVIAPRTSEGQEKEKGEGEGEERKRKISK